MTGGWAAAGGSCTVVAGARSARQAAPRPARRRLRSRRESSPRWSWPAVGSVAGGVVVGRHVVRRVGHLRLDGPVEQAGNRRSVESKPSERTTTNATTKHTPSIATRPPTMTAAGMPRRVTGTPGDAPALDDAGRGHRRRSCRHRHSRRRCGPWHRPRRRRRPAARVVAGRRHDRPVHRAGPASVRGNIPMEGTAGSGMGSGPSDQAWRQPAPRPGGAGLSQVGRARLRLSVPGLRQGRWRDGQSRLGHRARTRGGRRGQGRPRSGRRMRRGHRSQERLPGRGRGRPGRGGSLRGQVRQSTVGRGRRRRTDCPDAAVPAVPAIRLRRRDRRRYLTRRRGPPGASGLVDGSPTTIVASSPLACMARRRARARSLRMACKSG